MSKTRDTGFLGNVIKVDNGGNVSLVSGSTTLLSVSSSGAVTITGTISGSTAESAVSSSYALTASYSSNAELLDGMDSTMFAFTSSFNTTSASLDAGLKNVIARTGSFATTGSNVFYGNQTVSASVFVSGSVTATGQIVAQTINVQSVTSSVVYSSGSNVFGNDVANTQTFTGSMLITGSIRTTGNICATGTGCFGVVCSPTYVGGTVSGSTIQGTTIFASTIACSPIVCAGTSCATSFVGGTVSGTTLCTSNGIIGNNSNHLYLSSNSTTGEISFWANQLNTRLMTITSCGCVGIGTNNPSSTYGRLTVAGTGISIADDGNAKLQIGRFNSANCNAYIKMGINTCSLRFTNPGDTVDVVTFDKGGSVLIGTTATPVGKLDIATGGNTNVVISNDSTDTGYNIISLNGTRTKGSYAGIAGGGTGDDRLYLNSGVEVVIQTGASYTARMRTYATGPTCFSCPISITGAGSGTALNFGNSVANNILYINSYGGWSGIGMDATSATMRIAGDITEPNGIVQFGYYKGGTLNNACWCQKAVILTTGIGCFANTVCAPTFRGGSSLQLGGYAFQFTAAKNFNENTSDVEFFKIAMGGGQAAIFVNFSSVNSGTAAYRMQTYHGLLSNNWTGWMGCGIEVTSNPSCRANFAASSINSVATYTGCLVFRVSTTNNGTSTQATGTAYILVVTDGTVPTFTQL